MRDVCGFIGTMSAGSFSNPSICWLSILMPLHIKSVTQLMVDLSSPNRGPKSKNLQERTYVYISCRQRFLTEMLFQREWRAVQPQVFSGESAVFSYDVLLHQPESQLRQEYEPNEKFWVRKNKFIEEACMISFVLVLLEETTDHPLENRPA